MAETAFTMVPHHPWAHRPRLSDVAPWVPHLQMLVEWEERFGRDLFLTSLQMTHHLPSLFSSHHYVIPTPGLKILHRLPHPSVIPARSHI